MKLYPASESARLPSDRKILVTAREAGVEDRVALQPPRGGDTGGAPPADLAAGQVAVLERDDAAPVVGSEAICEYLDELHQRPKLMPRKGEARLEIQQLEAFSQVLFDAASARYRELARPQPLRWQDEADRQQRRMDAMLDRLEAVSGTVMAGPVTLGHIHLACVIDWIDARLPGYDWRAGRPGLAEWFAAFRARPSMRATAPAGAEA